MDALLETFGPAISLFDQLILIPLMYVLLSVYTVLTTLNIPYALGFSIIGLTIIIRIVFYPLTNKQLRASKKMQDVAPLISDIKAKYKGDSKKIQEETMKLYKSKGVNPAAGCLPVLVQLPVLLGLYQLINRLLVKLNPEQAMVFINSKVIDPLKLTEPWDTSFFGIPLGISPQQMLNEGMIVVAIAIPIVTGLFQFIQSKMMFASPPSDKNNKNKAKNDDFAAVFQKQAAYIFPIMIGFFSFNFVFGLSLYWNTFSIFGIIQQYKITGLGGLEPTWQRIKNRRK